MRRNSRYWTGVAGVRATQAEVPTKRDLNGTPSFFRTSDHEANACSGCHNQPESGGAGEFVTNVFASEGVNDTVFDTLDVQFSNERGTPPFTGSGLVELLACEMTADLQALRDAGVEKARHSGRPQIIHLESKGVSFGQLTAKPDGFIDIGEIDGIDFDLVVRSFSQKGVFTSLHQFNINAMNVHHGMQVPERYGSQWMNTADFDADGYDDEAPIGDITAMVAYQTILPAPKQVLPTHPVLVEAANANAIEPPEMIEETATAGITQGYDGGWEYYVGGGVASFDCNSDKYPELYFAGSSSKAGLFINQSKLGEALSFKASAE